MQSWRSALFGSKKGRAMGELLLSHCACAKIALSRKWSTWLAHFRVGGDPHGNAPSRAPAPRAGSDAPRARPLIGPARRRRRSRCVWKSRRQRRLLRGWPGRASSFPPLPRTAMASALEQFVNSVRQLSAQGETQGRARTWRPLPPSGPLRPRAASEKGEPGWGPPPEAPRWLPRLSVCGRGGASGSHLLARRTLVGGGGSRAALPQRGAPGLVGNLGGGRDGEPGCGGRAGSACSQLDFPFPRWPLWDRLVVSCPKPNSTWSPNLEGHWMVLQRDCLLWGSPPRRPQDRHLYPSPPPKKNGSTRLCPSGFCLSVQLDFLLDSLF